MIPVETWKNLAPLQKLPKKVGDLGKWLLPWALKSCPKSNKLPNLVTLGGGEGRSRGSVKATPYVLVGILQEGNMKLKLFLHDRMKKNRIDAGSKRGRSFAPISI